MSYLLNDKARFADDAADGFVAANRALVRRVPGGVARRTATPDGQVAVVIGGGSGHYPAFAGLVGAGLAHGAAMGNVFASPSAHQVHSVAAAVEAGGGVLLSYGNYAGDVLNFDQAEARLNDEGVPCRTVTVTDDVSSAGKDEIPKRRGLAGDLVVFRVAAWAAEQGRDLDGVHQAAARANDRTRTLGVAFSGTTLPGADEPLFTVPKGRMAVGMGIHGEPGIDEVPLPSADELAHLLVERLLDELPDGVTAKGAKAAVILNGLGAVKGEELFVVYTTVERLLVYAGVEIVDPDVGEFATSFEMAGVSLTLLWLDDELEQAWRSPAWTPAYRKGTAGAARGESLDDETTDADAPDSPPDASDESRALAPLAVSAIEAIRRVIDEHVDELGRLDAVAGDGDHGIGMQRGATAAASAAREAAEAGAGAGSVIALAGDAWADKAGGTSGALWGAALRAAGTRIGDDARPDRGTVVEAVQAGLDAVTAFGKAQVGDKTLVDALVPFAETLARGDGPLAADWSAAAKAATEAADATKDLKPKLGRARPHVEKSLGTPDPGAISLALAVTAIGDLLDNQRKDS